MKRIFFYYLIILQLFTILGCAGLEEGKGGVSDSVSESKEKKVFYTEKIFIQSINYDKIGESIRIKKCWIENMWNHGENAENIKIKNNLFQFIVTLDENLSSNIIDSISIVINDDPSTGLGIFGKEVYATNYYLKEIPDTLKLDFYLNPKTSNRKIKTVTFK